MINRGKQFEDIIRTQLQELKDTTVIRLYDVTTGFKNQNNICDFIVYKDKILYLIECKAIHGNTLNFKSHIRENQWEGLLAESYKSGVNAGVLVWFIDNDKTYWLDIKFLEALKQDNNKSFNSTKQYNNYKQFGKVVELKGKKKRVFFEYDIEKFFKEVKYYAK